MFSSVGYIDLRSIIISLIKEVEAQGGLYFPSIDHVSIEQLDWLAWRYGEWDFLEEAVFERALEAGLFVCSPEGRIMQVSMNPLLATNASAIDLFERDEHAFAFKEKLATNLPSNKNFEHKAEQDPWGL